MSYCDGYDEYVDNYEYQVKIAYWICKLATKLRLPIWALTQRCKRELPLKSTVNNSECSY